MDKKYEAQERYHDKAGRKAYTFAVYPKTEQDIIDQLDKQSNVNGYIKKLIREDIKKDG